MDRQEDNVHSIFKDVSTHSTIILTTPLPKANDGHLSTPSLVPNSPGATALAHDLTRDHRAKVSENLLMTTTEAAEAKVLASLHQSLHLPRHVDENRSVKWHNRLILLARRLLDLRGILYEERRSEGGLPQLVILPINGASHLNDFAHDVSTKLGGISFVYSPKELLKAEGNRARASFHREKNRILLPKGFLDHPRIDDAIYHEVLHAVFHDLLKNGIGSLFHGWIRSTDRQQPMWESSQYRFRMSLEELATHALNLELIAADFRYALAAGKADVVAGLLRRLRMKATTLHAIAGETAALLARAGERLSDEHSLSLEFNREACQDSGLGGLLWARLYFNHVEIKLPLLPEDPEQARYWELASCGEGDERTRVERHAILARFRRRVEKQKDVAAEMALQSAQCLRIFEELAVLDNSAIKTVGLSDGFWQALSAPRLLSLQYLHWA